MELRSESKAYIKTASVAKSKMVNPLKEALELLGEYEALYHEFGDDKKRAKMILKDYEELDKEALRVLKKKYQVKNESPTKKSPSYDKAKQIRINKAKIKIRLALRRRRNRKVAA